MSANSASLSLTCLSKSRTCANSRVSVGATVKIKLRCKSKLEVVNRVRIRVNIKPVLRFTLIISELRLVLDLG